MVKSIPGDRLSLSTTYSRQNTLIKELSEQRIRVIQGSFPYLKDDIPYEE